MSDSGTNTSSSTSENESAEDSTNEGEEGASENESAEDSTNEGEEGASENESAEDSTNEGEEVASVSDAEKKAEEEAYAELFRSEGIISDVDLLVEVAKDFSRSVEGDDTYRLSGDKTVHARQDYDISRASRNLYVKGNYSQAVYANTTFNMGVGGLIQEEAYGGVTQVAKADIMAMMGGSNINIVQGPYTLIGCWADYLVWGGWVEIDVARIEITAAALRVYVAFSHVSAAHITVAGRIMHDFKTRLEKSSVSQETVTNEVNASTVPGTSVTLNT